MGGKLLVPGSDGPEPDGNVNVIRNNETLSTIKDLEIVPEHLKLK